MKLWTLPLNTKTGADDIWHATQYLFSQCLSSHIPLFPVIWSEPQDSTVRPFGSPGNHGIKDCLLKRSDVIIEVHSPSFGSSHHPAQTPLS